MTAFGDELKQRREDRLYTMSYLGDLVGCGHSHVSRMEGGTANPSVAMVAHLAMHLSDEVNQSETFWALLRSWISDQLEKHELLRLTDQGEV